MTAAFGIGAYTPQEAGRLLHMPAVTLRNWLSGYSYTHNGEVREQPPLWTPQYDLADEQLLGFRDLVEARIVRALRAANIGLPTIRLCMARAREILGDGRPFSTKAFKSDGKRIFLEITEGVAEPQLLDLKQRQHVFRDVVEPSLQGLEFGDAVVERWWLLPRRETIVADPHRAFGQPVIADGGLLTARAVQEVRAEGSPERVARLYGIPVAAVRDALRFEQSLDAKRLH